MDNVTEASIKTSEIASRLGLEAVTVRKYCLELEKHRFLFQRNDGKNKDFTSGDFYVLFQVKHLIAVANVVVAGHVTSDDTRNEPPSVSVTVVKPDGIWDLEHERRYLDQQDDLMRNVQIVVSMKEMKEKFKQ